jgi:hypothetical protein
LVSGLEGGRCEAERSGSVTGIDRVCCPQHPAQQWDTHASPGCPRKGPSLNKRR